MFIDYIYVLKLHLQDTNFIHVDALYHLVLVAANKADESVQRESWGYIWREVCKVRRPQRDWHKRSDGRRSQGEQVADRRGS